MELWGVEVKSGEPCSVKKGEGKILHLSQACLGEVNKDQGSKSIRIYITVDGKKLVLGTLSPEKFHQQLFNLVLDRDFELSHNWNMPASSSMDAVSMIHVQNIHSYFLVVYFYLLLGTLCCGFGFLLSFYFALLLHLFSPRLGRWLFVFVTVSLDYPSPFIITSENGKTAKTTNADSTSPKQKVKEVEPKKEVKTLEEEDSSEEEEDGYTNSSSDFSSDSDTDSDVTFSDSESVEGETESDDDEEEEAPKKKVEQGKKRPADSAIEKPGPDKKAKLVTPQMTDAKKGGCGRVATPHPAKQAGRTPGTQSK